MRSFSYIVSSNSAADGHYVELLETKLKELVRYVLVQVEVDEHWYCNNYQDVAQAIQAGVVKSAQHHFISNGYFEDRIPRPIKVDEQWYLKEYPDVAQAIKRGVFDSGAQHFEVEGYKEGRLPHAGWSLLGVNSGRQI
jgi:hypothetical protein